MRIFQVLINLLFLTAMAGGTSFAEGEPVPAQPVQSEQPAGEDSTDVTTRGFFPNLQKMKYEAIINNIRRELGLSFSDPNDPGLYQRKQRLKKLFESVPPSNTKQLYERLGEKPTKDDLSKQFHYRLASATRKELLNILKKNFPSTTQLSPLPIPSATLIRPITEPLPVSESNLFNSAIQDLELKVAATHSSPERARRYACWLKKLRMSDVDDRFISWDEICPIKSGAIGAAMVVGACNIDRGYPVDQNDLDRFILSKNDVEKANNILKFIEHMKTRIVYYYDRGFDQFNNLLKSTEEQGKAVNKLDFWANAPSGGSSAMPISYRALKDWMHDRQNDPKSLYSCF